jgi:hypothetical protein
MATMVPGGAVSHARDPHEDTVATVDWGLGRELPAGVCGGLFRATAGIEARSPSIM